MAREMIAKCDKCGALAINGVTVETYRFTVDSLTPQKGDLCESCIQLVRDVLPRAAAPRKAKPGQPSPFHDMPPVQLD